jgi:ribonuclease HII
MSKTLETTYLNSDNIYELGIDEAGRGPLFGRVYSAGVILPKDNFDFTLIKDSKKFSSEKKIKIVAKYIKDNAIAWSVSYSTEQEIDNYNILQATYMSMHKNIKNILINSVNGIKFNNKNLFLLVDGNNFKDYASFNNDDNCFDLINYKCITGGDNKYASIAAASILAKVERDEYINDLCVEYPELIDKYKINSNKGYGTKTHLDGIKTHGITKFHRKTFGICKQY